MIDGYYYKLHEEPFDTSGKTLYIHQEDWEEMWQHAIVPKGTKIVLIIMTWASYRDRVELGDCDVL